jgi:hypothetical protein
MIISVVYIIKIFVLNLFFVRLIELGANFVNKPVQVLQPCTYLQSFDCILTTDLVSLQYARMEFMYSNDTKIMIAYHYPSVHNGCLEFNDCCQRKKINKGESYHCLINEQNNSVIDTWHNTNLHIPRHIGLIPISIGIYGIFSVNNFF